MKKPSRLGRLFYLPFLAKKLKIIAKRNKRAKAKEPNSTVFADIIERQAGCNAIRKIEFFEAMFLAYG